MESLIDHYESVAVASHEMLAAARRGDWEALVAAENACAARVQRLRAASAERSLDAAHQARKAQIIRQVLAHDAEIRALANPWLARLCTLIGESTRRRRVNDAYAARLP